jgi:uncharacterized surface protein with fasciclin (FAS1) repeats
MKHLFLSKVVSGVIGFSALMGCAGNNGQASSSLPVASSNGKGAQLSDIVDTAVAAGNFSVLASALGAAELVETLKSAGPFTVFAPTDEAFAKIPSEQLDAILADKALLTKILTYHVIAGRLLAADVLGQSTLTSLEGSPINVSLNGDAAFVNESKIILTDVLASNGVIHAIDTVLLPPAAPAEEAPEEEEEEEAPMMDIIDTAVGNGNFTVLATALTEAGLIDTLKSAGPFTVFAPTDVAFAKIPSEQLSAILADKALLTKILTYHVVPGKLAASDVLSSCSLTSVEGSAIKVSLDGSDAFVNQSKITLTDVFASNGVIHVIDTVLLPPNL